MSAIVPYVAAVAAASGVGGDQPNANLPANVLASCSSPVTVTVGYRFPVTGPGDVEALQGCTNWNDVGDYVDSKTPPFNPALFECMCSVTSGPNPTGGDAIDTWLSLGSNRSWVWSAAGTFQNGVWLIQVREIADTGNADSGNFTWDTEDGS